MLDLDHPQAPHIFAAARQLELIGEYLHLISFAASKERLFLLDIIRPCFAAIRWLQVARFADESNIAARIDDLELATERLARLGDGQAKWSPDETPPSKCPVCRQQLTTYGVYEPQPGVEVPEKRWCSPCMEVVMPALERLQSIDEGFGTEAI